ncbi:MAG: AAA family ATPase [Herpetosiphonaceae bacterium]|nr:AAA family ATPase [Herpetosiphonaceae bacterium]
MPQGETPAQLSPNLPLVFATGDAGTDLVMNGGIPSQATTLIIGPPGAGKTVLALQIGFAAAQTGRNVVYLTNISESHIRMLQHARNFSFFNESLIRQNFNLISINSSVQQQGIDATLNFIMDVARSAKADILIIDSYLGLKQLFQSEGPQGRNLMFTLSSRLSMLAVTTILLGEYRYDDIHIEPEFAVADAIVELSYSIYGLMRSRYLSVIKMRGKAFLEGLHRLTISDKGITVFPRQESLPLHLTDAVSTERVSLGIPQLDTMLSGGVFAGSTSLVAGGAGIGKTLLGLHFLMAGAPDEVGLMVSFQESEAQLRQRLAELTMGPHLAKHIEILHLSSIELILDQAAWMIRQKVVHQNIRRIVIDTIDSFEQSSQYQQRINDFIRSLITMLSEHHVTAILIYEMPFMQGQYSFANINQRYSTDTIIFMHHVEINSRLQRSITVVKQRGSNHDQSLRQMDIIDGNITIGAPFSNLSHILTGLPIVTSIDSEKESARE